MSNVGQIAFTLIGTVAGAFLGNPALGFAVGSTLGNVLFPSRPKSPGIQDGHISGASEGTPIPYVIGNYRVAGDVISHGPFKQHDGGGKGGPPGQTTTTISFRLSVCDNQDGKKTAVRKIWFDGGLVYDKGEAATANTVDNLPRIARTILEVTAANNQVERYMTVYLGGPAQMPDPTEEAILGVGMVPPHRGYLDIVFTDLPVTEYGSRIPNIEVEVIEGSSILQPPEPYFSDVLFPWVDGNKDPRNCSNDHQYLANYTGAVWRDRLEDAIHDWVTLGLLDVGDTITVDASSFNNLVGWSNDGRTLSRTTTLTSDERVDLWLHFNRYDPSGFFNSRSHGADTALICGMFYTAGFNVGDPPFWWSGLITETSAYDIRLPAVVRLLSHADSLLINSDEAAVNNCIEYPPSSGFFPVACAFYDRLIAVRRVPRGPDNPCFPRCRQLNPLVGFDFCVLDKRLERNVPFTKITAAGGHSFAWLADIHTHSGPPLAVDGYPLGPALYDTDPHYADSAWWNAAYAAARIAHPTEIPSGMSYSPVSSPDGLHYPVLRSYAWQQGNTLELLRPHEVTMADALTRICAKAGIADTDIDVSGLTSTIWGMAIIKAGATGRDMATPLMRYGFIDAYDDGEKLIFRQRGGSAVATLTEDDLGAFESSAGSNSESRLQIVRTNDYELPRDVRVRFANQLSNYQDGMQSSPRQIAQGIGESDIDLGIAMTPTQARKVAEVLSRVAWLGRETGKIAVNGSWLSLLRPGAPFNITAGGITRRYLAQNPNYQFPGLLTLDIIRDEQNLYETLVAANDGDGAKSSLILIAPSALIVLDLPALKSGDEADAGVYVAPYPLLGTTTAGGIYESKDAGASYDLRASFTETAAVGKIRTALPTGSPTVIDLVTTLVVDMDAGTLAGVTDAAITGGANAFAIGAPGRWTIVQARDITLNMDGSYTLTGFYQGLKNTLANRGTSVAGDAIVQLDSRLRRIHESASEIGQTRLLRIVTSGTSLADAVDTSFTVTGLSYVPSLTGSAPPHSIIIGGGTGTAGSPVASIPPTTAGNVLVDQGPAADPAYKTISGDGTLSSTGALTVTKTGGVAFTSAAITPLDTDGALAANSDARIATQKAIKTYVDGKVAGLSWKQAVRAATTTAGTLASSFANGSVIDTITLATGDRILIKDQSTGSENGYYLVAASGAPTRTTDADAGSELVNATVYVSEGAINADTQWTCSTNAPITVGSTALTFAQLSTGSYDLATDVHGATGKTTPADNDELPLIDSATGYNKKKLLWSNLKAGIWSAFGALIAGGTAKTTPVDGDLLPIADSAASNATKSLSWLNVKATLKAYFDTLYTAGGAITGSGLTMSTSRLLGRTTAGTGAVQELTLSNALDLIGSTARGDILYRGAAGWQRLAAGTTGRVLQTLGSSADPQWVDTPATSITYQRSVTFENYPLAIVAGDALALPLECPMSGTITAIDLLTDNVTTGSCVVDVWKAAGAYPTVANTIVSGTKPTISSGTSLTGYSLANLSTTTVAAGDWIVLHLDSVSSFKVLKVVITIRT